MELDKSLLPVLAETMAPYPNVEIVPGDVMKLDLAALAAERLSGLRPIVCANLPYNITTPVLTKLIETPCFETVTVLDPKGSGPEALHPRVPEMAGRFPCFCSIIWRRSCCSMCRGRNSCLRPR